MRDVRSAAVLLVWTAAVSGCSGASEPPATRPRLLSPSRDALVRQNDPVIGCPADQEYGYGYRLAFDWTDVPGAAGYHIRFGRTGAIPLLRHDVEESAFSRTECGSYVDESLREGWSWRVGALFARENAPPDTSWSEDRRLNFGPCQFPDGRYCFKP